MGTECEKCGESIFWCECKQSEEEIVPTAWISVKDRLPEEPAEVLSFGEYGIYIATFKTDRQWHKKVWVMKNGIIIDPVTHWMPLPEQQSIPKRARCHECGRFVSKRELAKVPTNGVPWCDACVSLCD